MLALFSVVLLPSSIYVFKMGVREAKKRGVSPTIRLLLSLLFTTYLESEDNLVVEIHYLKAIISGSYKENPDFGTYRGFIF